MDARLTPEQQRQADLEYRRRWSRERRAELRAAGLNANGRPYTLPATDPRRQPGYGSHSPTTTETP